MQGLPLYKTLQYASPIASSRTIIAIDCISHLLLQSPTFTVATVWLSQADLSFCGAFCDVRISAEVCGSGAPERTGRAAQPQSPGVTPTPEGSFWTWGKESKWDFLPYKASLPRVWTMDTLSLSVNAVSSTVAAEIPTTDDPFSGPIKNIAPWNFTVLAVVMFVVTSLSLTENFLVMFVTFKFKQLRQPLNYIIVNLAIADFLVSLTGGLISFLTNARGYFFLGRWACVLEGFAVTFFGRFRLLFWTFWTLWTDKLQTLQL